MPNVLVLSESEHLASRLDDDPRCQVTRAIHTTHNAPPSPNHKLGSPDMYDIVIHDCQSSIDEELDIAQVGDDFLQEVSALGGISIALIGESEEYDEMYGHIPGVKRVAPKGFQSPVVYPSQFDQSWTLEPYLDKFSQVYNGGALDWCEQRNPIYTPPLLPVAATLAQNQYNQAVIVSADAKLSQLAMPNIEDINIRAQALHSFITRTIFQLHPRIISAGYSSPLSRDIERDIANNIHEFRLKDANLQQRLATEQEWLAIYSPIVSLMDEGLKQACISALKEFDLECQDLDQLHGNAKTIDLFIKNHGVVIETRGSTRRNANVNDIVNVSTNAERAMSKGIDVKHKVLLYNGQLAITVVPKEIYLGLYV